MYPFQLLTPYDGTSPRILLNTNRKPVANTKLGIVAPSVDNNMSSRSTNLFCLSAAIIPKNTPTTSTMADAQTPILKE